MITLTIQRPGYIDGLKQPSPKWASLDMSWVYAQSFVKEHFRHSGNWENVIRVDYPGGACIVRRNPQ